ncbi:hypothetical protein NLJ89_g2054 [Agrocybe chaxingu]|uniref:F-box domain-containing protein n=1 Tax=Agrocybe chaxingu TaxID=84603 RepID=A0A9W8KCP1_9AGAR|nr:hypothetical protein NLJ89_g2054 [Agrocybe chaxingu]
MNFLPPPAIFALRKLCRICYKASLARSIWTSAVRNEMENHQIPAFTFPLSSMEGSALERLAMSPYLFDHFLDDHTIGPRNPHVIRILLNRLEKWTLKDLSIRSRSPGYKSVHLAPGGRFLVTSSSAVGNNAEEKTLVQLWDIGVRGHGYNSKVLAGLVLAATQVPAVIAPSLELPPCSLQLHGNCALLAYNGKIFIWDILELETNFAGQAVSFHHPASVFSNLLIHSHFAEEIDDEDDSSLRMVPQSPWKPFPSRDDKEDCLALFCETRAAIHQVHKLDAFRHPSNRLPGVIPVQLNATNEFAFDYLEEVGVGPLLPWKHAMEHLIFAEFRTVGCRVHRLCEDGDNLNQLSIDVLVIIMKSLPPPDIFILRQLCKSCHKASLVRSVWTCVLQNEMEKHDVPFFTPKLSSMDQSSLEKLAMSPHLFNNLLDTHTNKEIPPNLTRILPNHLHERALEELSLTSRNYGYKSIHVAPGGRFLVTSATGWGTDRYQKALLQLWDIGMRGHGYGSKVLASLVLDAVEESSVVLVPSLDGKGFYLVCVEQEVALRAYKIADPASSPAITHLNTFETQVDGDGLKSTSFVVMDSRLACVLDKGHLVVWDFESNTSAIWETGIGSISDISKISRKILHVHGNSVFLSHKGELFLWNIPKLEVVKGSSLMQRQQLRGVHGAAVAMDIELFAA